VNLFLAAGAAQADQDRRSESNEAGVAVAIITWLPHARRPAGRPGSPLHEEHGLTEERPAACSAQRRADAAKKPKATRWPAAM